MGQRDRSDLEADLSKKQRLINAWIAVGPEGKTTDVSELTDASRGYASDIRRAIEGEDEDEDELTTDELQDAYDPDLVAAYRAELDDDALDGEWDVVRELESTAAPTGQAQEQPATPPEEEQAPPTPSEIGARQGPPPAQTHTPPTAGAGDQYKPIPGSGDQSTRQPQAGGHPGGQMPQSGGGTPPQGQPRQAATPHAQQPPTGGGGQPPQQQPQAPGQAPATGVQQPRQSLEQTYQSLQHLDTTLAQRQQQAQSELHSVQPQSPAYALAVSKYNLIVEVRQSLRGILNQMAL